MKILVADVFPDSALAELAEHGHECVYEPDTTAEELSGSLPGCEAVIVRSTKVTAEAFEAADSLRLVIRAGSGTNTIDCDAATRNQVYVCNVPGRNAVAVAELAFGLLLAIDRHIPDNVADLRDGHWDKRRYAKARGILGRKIGIIGLGQIGLVFAQRAAAFGASVYTVAKEHRDAETLNRAHAIAITFVDSVETLARTCDVLSLHVPGDSCRGLLGRRLLSELRPGAIVLNTARGDVIDEQALIEAMDVKGVRAGLDVFAGEPGTANGSFDCQLAKHPNVYGTHHIGASTEQAQQAVADGVVEIVDRFQNGAAPHCVNLSGVNLSGVNSSGVNSSGVNLSAEPTVACLDHSS